MDVALAVAQAAGSGPTNHAATTGSQIHTQPSNPSYTQDFLCEESVDYEIGNAQYEFGKLLVFSPYSRFNSARWSHINLWQTYRINRAEVEIAITQVVSSDTTYGPQSFVFYIAPYSRSEPSENAFHAGSIPGCQAKLFSTAGMNNHIQNQILQVGFGINSVQQGLSISCANDAPQYEIASYSSSSSNIAGQKYSNNPLSIFSNVGDDKTNWNCFYFTIEQFAVNQGGTTVKYFFNMLWKVNVTFEGYKWDQTQWGTISTNPKLKPPSTNDGGNMSVKRSDADELFRDFEEYIRSKRNKRSNDIDSTHEMRKARCRNPLSLASEVREDVETKDVSTTPRKEFLVEEVRKVCRPKLAKYKTYTIDLHYTSLQIIWSTLAIHLNTYLIIPILISSLYPLLLVCSNPPY